VDGFIFFFMSGALLLNVMEHSVPFLLLDEFGKRVVSLAAFPGRNPSAMEWPGTFPFTSFLKATLLSAPAAVEIWARLLRQNMLLRVPLSNQVMPPSAVFLKEPPSSN